MPRWVRDKCVTIMVEGIGSMHELALRMAAFGEEFLIVDGTIFAVSFLYLVIQMIRRGKVGTDQGQVVTTQGMMGNSDPAVRGISKQKVFYSRFKRVSMASLVKGTASRQDWYLVVGFNIAMLALVFMFLGIGLILLPEGHELGFAPSAIIFAIFPFVVAPMIIRMQYVDYMETRERLKCTRTQAMKRP
jgi:hypothetical protein